MQKPKPFKFSDDSDPVDTKHVISAKVTGMCSFMRQVFYSKHGIIPKWIVTSNVQNPDSNDVWFILNVKIKSCYKDELSYHETIISDGRGWYNTMSGLSVGFLLMAGHNTMSIKSKHIINAAINNFCQKKGINS